MLTKNKPALPIASSCDPEGCQGCPDCPEVPFVSHTENRDPKINPATPFTTVADIIARHSNPERRLELLAESDMERWLERAPGQWYGMQPIPPPTNTGFNPENTLNPVLSGVGLDYQEPKLPASMRCPFFGMDKYKVMRCASGIANYQPLPCSKCPQCREAWVWRKLYRYSEGVRRSNVQTLITVDGLADDSAAAEVRTYLGNRLRTTRVGIINHTPDDRWQVVVVTAEAISRHDYVLADKFTALRYPTAEIAFCDRMVSPDYLRQFLNCKNKTPGGHKPIQFSHDWITEASNNTYQWNDGIVGCLPTGAPALKPAKHVCQGCRETQEKYPDVEGRAAHNAMAWLEGRHMEYQALADMVAGDMEAYRRLFPNHDYEGPKRLINDLWRSLVHQPEAINRYNPRGLVLRHDARLAMVLAYAHTLETVTVTV